MLATKKYTKILKIAAGFFIATTAIFLLANFSLAADPGDLDVGLDKAAGTGLSNEVDIRIIIARVIRIALGFLGIIAVSLIIYAGWLWMTSAGNEDKIEQAKNILKNAVIGLIIILSAFAIASFILNKLTEATGGGDFGGPGGGGGGGGIGLSGGNIVDYTFPANNQEGVPRNLMRVSAVLNEPVKPETFKAENAEIQVYTVDEAPLNKEDSIYKSPLADSSLGRWLEKLPLVKNLIKYFAVDKALASTLTANQTVTNVEFRVINEDKTLVFDMPYEHGGEYLGSPKATVWYTVTLKEGIMKPDGKTPLFPPLKNGGQYRWKFAVGTEIDNTPPKIISVIPEPNTTEHRNVVVQINFSEAIDPTSASGVFKGNSGFNNIRVMDNADSVPLEGTFYISNQYRTVEFLTFDACDINSCGQTIFCLPPNKRLKVAVKAATLMEPPAPAAVWNDNGYNGVVDMAGNSLDGNGDGTAQGPASDCDITGLGERKICSGSGGNAGPGDNVFWLFDTDNKIDKTPPKITSIKPGVASNQVGIEDIPNAVFSKALLSSSLTKLSIMLKSLKPGDPELYYWVSSFTPRPAPAPAPGSAPAVVERQTTVYVGHNQFNNVTKYSIQFNSGIKDIYQNCYTPCSGIGKTGTPSCCQNAAGVMEQWGGNGCP